MREQEVEVSMSDDDIRRMIEEATKESLRQSFTDAGRKFIDAAAASERRGDYEGADRLYRQAADAYEKAAQKYREGKGYKGSAFNMCAAGDVYSELGESAKAVESYGLAAEDLLAASGEHLLWGEDAETAKGTALAMTACMIYIMIGKEADGFYKARTFSAENASKLRFPAIVRLSQIPQMLETSVQSLDLEGFSAAETAAVTELKAALANANAQEFSKYVDKGLDMVREILRGKLKIPKIVPQLVLPSDMTFTDEFPVGVAIRNTGEGEARNLQAEWLIDEGLVVVSGDQKRSIQILPAGESLDLAVVVRAAEALAGEKDYSLLVKGTYSDKLRTEYSFQAGPGTLVLKDYKESEKLLQGLDVTDSRIGILGASVEESPLEKEPLHRFVAELTEALKTARTQINEGDLPAAKAQIKVVNSLVDAIDSILGDEELARRVEAAKEARRRTYARVVLKSLKESIDSSGASRKTEIDTSATEDLAGWEKDAEARRGLSVLVMSSKDNTSDLVRDLEALYNEMPTSAGTDDPEEASARSKARTELETAIAKLIGVRSELERILADKSLLVGARPATSEKAKFAKEHLDKILGDISSIIESKETELQ
jgi:tetratricopeptide (TPR) repeat protein